MNTTARRIALAITASSVAITLAACGSGRTDDPSTTPTTGGTTTDAQADPIAFGTTEVLTSLDPAASYDGGSFHYMTQVYSLLMNYEPGSNEVTPDAAEDCGFVSDTVYECTIKDGLTFANGNPLNAESVKFSFDRMTTIADPAGPSSLFGGLESTEVVDDLTVRFNLVVPNDQIWELMLASPAAPIVDQGTFAADAVTPDEDIIAGNAFSGPYTIGSFAKNELAEFLPNPDYVGNQGQAQVPVTHRVYTDSSNMRLEIASGEIDIAWRSLAPTDIEALQDEDGVDVITGPGVEIRYMIFNFDLMPGDTPEQKQAIRKAVASLVDRQEISEQVFKGTFTPLYTMVPAGFPGAVESFADLYGKTPDAAAAEQFLADAGVETPVDLHIQYTSDRYGPNSVDEYNAIKRQLDDSGLFNVTLESAAWSTYAAEYNQDLYPILQLGWFPDYSDADNYLSPFFHSGQNFTNNHYENARVDELLDAQRSEADQATRLEMLAEVQEIAADEIPTLPMQQGAQIAVVRDGIVGVSDTLDPSYKFRFSVLSRS